MIHSKFRLFPTATSGLTLADYTVEIPAPEQWSLRADRPGESTLTLAGTTAHAYGVYSVTSATPRYRQVMTETEYQALTTLVEHATVTTWMLAAEGRLFEVVLDVTGDDRIQRGARIMRQVEMNIRIVREVVFT